MPLNRQSLQEYDSLLSTSSSSSSSRNGSWRWLVLFSFSFFSFSSALMFVKINKKKGSARAQTKISNVVEFIGGLHLHLVYTFLFNTIFNTKALQLQMPLILYRLCI